MLDSTHLIHFLPKWEKTFKQYITWSPGIQNKACLLSGFLLLISPIFFFLINKTFRHTQVKHTVLQSAVTFPPPAPTNHIKLCQVTKKTPKAALSPGP